ncbi:MAG: cytochrome P450 [Calditrichia bacterium]
MASFNIPDGYGFWHTLRDSQELVHSPIQVMERSLQRFGDTYSAPIGPKRHMILTRDADFIAYVLQKNHRNYAKSEIHTDILSHFLGNGLLTSNGDFWLRQRRLIQPGFHVQKIVALYGLIEQAVEHCLANFPSGSEVDIYPHINQLAFEVVVRSLFNVDIPSATLVELSAIISDVQNYVVREVRQPLKRPWLRLSGQRGRELNKARQSREIIRSIIQDRVKSGTSRGDLLDMMLEARYEDSGEPMEEEQLIDELMILVIAGHETTANGLAWMLHLLANNPVNFEELEKKWSLSIEEAVRDPFLNAVVKESMRLYPPAWISDRLTLNDDEFGEYSYPENSLIVTFLYGLHRHPEYWPEAEAFKPERFLPENTTESVKKAYYPFGAGPRMCIGNNFALAEMVLFLQRFTKKFHITKTTHTPKAMALVTLRPDQVVLNVKRR